MQPSEWPQVRDLVLIGGGHAHALVLRKWAMAPQAGVRVTLVNPGPVTPYTGMLPGHIAGHYTRSEMMIDLVRLCRFAGARIVLDRVVGLDREARHVVLKSGRTLRYDVASIDIGIGSDLPDLPGFTTHAVAAKPLGDYAEQWQAFVKTAPAKPNIVIVGAGIGGVELAMASAFRLRAAGTEPTVTLLEKADTILSGVGPGAQLALQAELDCQRIKILTGVSPASVSAQGVTLDTGETLASDFTLSVAGARPQDWLARTGLDLTVGFVTIKRNLQSSDPAIFAVGDCAHMAFAPRPKAGVFAVRQAPVLLHNLRRALSGKPLRRFRPQRDYLKLISAGDKRAVADKFGRRLQGAWLWRWKDRIDRKFMAKFETYPQMPAPKVPKEAASGLKEALGDKPICGGCGAKVGAVTLREVLRGLPAPQRKDVKSGPGDDAAVLAAGQSLQVITTDHLRSVTHDPALMARIAAVHALGDIWAMGAAPQSALAQITLPRLGPELQADMLAQIMGTAAEVITAAGADIVGGHTTVGSELTIGFTVTGVVDRVIAKSGAQPGDRLILTKPIGTGTILAAEMALAKVPGIMLGESVAACLTSMIRPLGAAAKLLSPHATAMTDVTGFGLAGHLLEILQASRVAATLEMAAVPLLAGAEAAAKAGHASSLAPANRESIAWLISAAHNPTIGLLFDPQTAGGLLATVPEGKAEKLLAALIRQGETAAIIGKVTKGPAFLTVI